MRALRWSSAMVSLMGSALAVLGCGEKTSVGSSGTPNAYESRARAAVVADPAQGRPWLLRVAEESSLDPGVHQIESLTAVDDYIYFTVSWGGLYRTAKHGGRIEVVDAGERNRFAEVGSVGSDVVWINMTFDDRDYPFMRLLRRATSGGPTKTLLDRQLGTLSTNTSDQFLVNEAGVFMTAGPNGAGSRHGILRVAPDGMVSTVLPLREVFDAPAWTADQTHLYFAPPTETKETTLSRVGIAGGAPEPFATVPIQDARVRATDGTHVYLTSSGAIWKVAKSDAQATALVTTEMGIDWHLAVDATHVYYLEFPRGDRKRQLRAVPKAGGDPVLLANVLEGNRPGISRMAQDREDIYLLNDSREILVYSKSPPPPPAITAGSP